MDTARASFGVDAVRSQFHYTGDGDGIKGNYSINDVVVAVIDSGVNANHPDLRGKLRYWKDFVAGRTSAYDDNGHGTLVAGVAVGAGKLNRKLIGVAPEAALIVLKVLDSSGSGSVSDCVAAIDEVIDKKNEWNIRVLNLSLAVSGSSAGKDSFSAAANRAVAAGIVVTVAAGNDGPDDKTIGAPSAAENVITVGAGADLGEKGFYLASFSGRGPTADRRVKPDLWAPGVKIQSVGYRGGYSVASGTSFSTPFVAGVAALMLEANPFLTPGKVKTILIRSAQRWGPGAKTNEGGSGRLQAYEAITRAAAITTGLNPPEVPKVLFVRSTISLGEIRNHTFVINDIKHFIAVTAVIYNAPGSGLLMELLSPNGNVVSSEDEFSRQEQLVFKPNTTGIYTLRLTGFGATSLYLLNISADQD